MAEVTLSIGGHHYALTCADGEEQELLRLGELVDEQVSAARTAVGGLTEVRQLLFAALFLADKLAAGTVAAEPMSDTAGQAIAGRIDALADQVTRISTRLGRA